ncbi:MAG: hypothetical protein ACRCSK_03635 [Fusobacteriaceae bacterium]
MKEEDFEELKSQLEEYRQEKERVRKLVGQIGSRKGSRFHKIVSQVFILVVLLVFILSVVFHSIPYTTGLQLGILFASIKVIWMIYDQQKMNHFQFWILSSLELKINKLEKDINILTKDK